MKNKKVSIKNIIFLVIILLLIIPQTRQPIQVLLHKGFALFSPSIENESNRVEVSSYNWELEDLNGNTFNFNEMKGNVVLVNIWATWCPPCIAEMPSLQELSNDYKDKIDFVFVSSEKQAVLEQFLKKNNYSLDVYIPKTEAPETFNVRSIPRTFLIDQKGNIIIDKSGAANWNSDKVRATIDKLLKL